MSQGSSSFELFGLMVKIPDDSASEPDNAHHSYNQENQMNSITNPSKSQYEMKPSPSRAHEMMRAPNRTVVQPNHAHHSYNQENLMDSITNPSKSQYEMKPSPSRAHEMIRVPNRTVVQPNYAHQSYNQENLMDSTSNTSASDFETKPSAPLVEISVENSFDDMVSEQPSQKKKTLIVLDCANIGWGHGEDHFSIPGIVSALSFFSRWNVEIAAFIPSSYLKKKPRDGRKGNSVMETDDWEQLATLVRTGDITVVPAGDHDDVYILSFARSNNGFIVSNDFFSDHISSLQEPSIQKSMKLWLNVNRCGFTFMKSTIFMINPGNVLSTVLGYLNFQEKILHFDENCGRIINALSDSIKVLLECQGFPQLKYLLLARATSYMEVRLSYYSTNVMLDQTKFMKRSFKMSLIQILFLILIQIKVTIQFNS